MADHQVESGPPLKILHVLRAPLGGLFRHVLDLAQEQVARGHAVGIIADSSTGGETAIRHFAELEPRLALGLSRIAMRRSPHPTDIMAIAHAQARIGRVAPDVVHGHGSKGGIYARVPGFLRLSRRAICVYTPHGGSLNYRAGPWTRRIYMAVERLLAWRTDVVLFESAFIADRYHRLVGAPRGVARVVHNGIGLDECMPVSPRDDAAEFLYVGELRAAKGIDTFLDALAIASKTMDKRPRAVLVGAGPDRDGLLAHARRIGLSDQIEFAGVMPARQAFERGRVVIVPSRSESMPYIVLEAAAARVPLIATHVGGIPEIFGPFSDRLVAPDDAAQLADRMIGMIAASDQQRFDAARDLGRYVQEKFSLHAMVDGVIDAYRAALAHRSARGPVQRPQVALSS